MWNSKFDSITEMDIPRCCPLRIFVNGMHILTKILNTETNVHYDVYS